MSAELLGVLSGKTYGTGSAAQTASGQVSGLSSSLNSIPRTVTTDIITNHVDNYYSAGSQGTAINRHAAGGLFEIPSSYGNEGFRLGNGDTASGGEGINIIPKSQMNKGSNDSQYKALLEAVKPNYDMMANAIANALSRIIR
jgi:hypothetical protein